VKQEAKHILTYLLLFLATTIVQADHLLGGELYYEHVQNDEYDVFVQLYRDCNGCKIDGEGGGSSTSNCGKTSLLLRSSEKNGCNSRLLKRYTLDRVSIVRVLPICSKEKDACQSGATQSFGVERHLFKARVDLSDFPDFTSCGFEFYISATSRALNFTNLNNPPTGSEYPLYNYCYINPSVKESSPTYSGEPVFLANCNATLNSVYFDFKNIDKKDSISIKSSNSLKGYNDAIGFTTGYTKKQPLTVYCTNVDCAPNPINTPAEGFYVGATNGQISYTPTKCADKVNLVFELERWVRVDDEFILASVIRRDFVQQIGVWSNASPELKEYSSLEPIYLCADQNYTLDLLVKDTVLRLPDGTLTTQDSVTITAAGNVPNSILTAVTIASAPYQKLRFDYTGNISDISNEPYYLDIHLADNFCPFNSENTYRIPVYITAPSPELKTEQLWCGRLELKNLISSDSAQWSVNSGNPKKLAQRVLDTFYTKRAGAYAFKTTVFNKGCQTNWDTSYNLTTKDVIAGVLDYTFSGNFCLFETGIVSHTNIDSFDQAALWQNGLEQSRSSIQLPITHPIDTVIAYTEKTEENYTCIDTHYVAYSATQSIDINWLEPVECANRDVDLMNFIEPQGGVFTDHYGVLDGSVLKVDSLPELQSRIDYCFEYSVADASGCISIDTVCIRLLASPPIVLRDQYVCNNEIRYNLDNAISQPFDYFNFTRRWTYQDQIIQPEFGSHWIKMDTFPNGLLEFVLTISYPNGCVEVDTLFIDFEEDIVIEFEIPDLICQNDDIDLSSFLKVDRGFGTWSSTNQPNSVWDNQLLKEYCGEIDLYYYYDFLGCFAEKDTTIDVLCKPELTFDLPDTACRGAELVLDPYTTVDEWTANGRVVASPYVIPYNMDSLLQLTMSRQTSTCTFFYRFDVAIFDPPGIVLSKPFPAEICQDDRLIITIDTVTNGSLWDAEADSAIDVPYAINDSMTSTGLIEYIYLAKGKGYCPVQPDTFTVRVNPRLKALGLTYPLRVCAIANLNPIFNWSTPPGVGSSVEWNLFKNDLLFRRLTENAPVFMGLDSGEYQLRVNTTSVDGCNWLAEGRMFKVLEKPKARFVMNPDGILTTRYRDMEFFNQSSSSDTLLYTWDFGFPINANFNKTNPRITYPKDTGLYIVSLIAETIEDCSDTFIDTIKIGGDIELYVPNAFSPNDRGPEKNDVFGIHARYFKSYRLVVRSRLGEIVHISDDPNDAWDGVYKGKPCPAGVYTYTIDMVSLNDEKYLYNGVVNLLR
jgi:gliding motility-associated-like protein